MVFDKIATGITKHYKLVVVVWIAALLLSVPAMLQVNSAVQYNSDFGSGDGYESIQAQEIIAKYFTTSQANGTLIILLQADNITDAEARDFVLQLQKNLEDSGDIKYMEGVTTVYSYYGTVLNTAIPELGSAIRPVEQNVSMVSSLMWGIPAIYLSNYTVSGSDDQAYAYTSAYLNGFLAQVGADANTTALAYQYYNGWANVWNQTAALYPDPSQASARATNAVQTAGGAIIQNLPAEQAQMAGVMQMVLGGFNLTNFSSEALAHQYALGMISTGTGITNMTYLQDIYDLGPAYDSAEVAAYTSSLIENGTLATYLSYLPEASRDVIQTSLVSNFVSSNNETMLMMVTFSVDSAYTLDNGDKPLMDNTWAIRDEIGALKDQTGAAIDTYVTGDAAISADQQTSSEDDMSMIEPITIIIILVLMGYLFRSVLGQFLPLGAVGVAVGMSTALVFVIGSTIAQINYTVLTMLFAVLLGVGTDYSIFIITRYREERIRGANREQAVQASVTWAGESIVTSGATVIIAFLAMATASFSFVQTMGLLLGLSIVVALLIALTFVPALLMLFGNRIFWPTTGKRFERFAEKTMRKKAEGNHGYFHRAASFSVKHAKVVILAAVLVSVPTTYIYMTQETNFDFIGSMGDAESIHGMQAMSEDFGAGMIMPTQVVVTGDTTVLYENGSLNTAYLDAIDELTATIAADSMVQQVTSVTRPYDGSTTVDYANFASLPLAEQKTMLGMIGSDNKTVLITVVLKEEPQSSSAVDFIEALRGDLADVKAEQAALADSTILVGGSTAVLYDMSLSTTQQFTNIEILVIIGIFIVLMIVLGSLLLPAFAVVSIAMSISWAFAATSLVFGAWLGKPILWIIPLILFVMLMGIGMDYNVFILTRIREEVHKGKAIKQAVVDAVDWTGGIITALAIIMAGAFGSIMLSSNTMLQEFGFALFLAVLLDAMVVRTYIVPAAIVLMGKWAWWAPGRLQREGRKEKMEAKKAESEDAPGK